MDGCSSSSPHLGQRSAAVRAWWRWRPRRPCHLRDVRPAEACSASCCCGQLSPAISAIAQFKYWNKCDWMGETKRPSSVYLGGSNQLRCACSNLVRGGNELLVLTVFIDHPVSRVSKAKKSLSSRLKSRDDKGVCTDTYSSCVAPQPTALEAEMSPSVQREFLA